MIEMLLGRYSEDGNFPFTKSEYIVHGQAKKDMHVGGKSRYSLRLFLPSIDPTKCMDDLLELTYSCSVYSVAEGITWNYKDGKWDMVLMP